MIIYRWWHDWLDMPRKNQAWHIDDIADELAEWEEAVGVVDRWSELSDIVYTVTRARWGGYSFDFPIGNALVIIGSIYMFPKYTNRWLFYFQAGRKVGTSRKMTEVRNPAKLHKLHHIANKYDVDPELFTQICERQLKYWPLLK